MITYSQELQMHYGLVLGPTCVHKQLQVGSAHRTRTKDILLIS